MARTCTACASPKRPDIDAALVKGESNRAIARQHGLSKDAVARHAESHLPARLAQAQEAEDKRQALDVVAQLRAINGACLGVLRDARASGKGDLVLRAADRVLRQLELQARLLGDLDDRPNVNVALVTSPEWLTVRGALLAALAPYPEARAAVAQALLAPPEPRP